MIRPKVRVRIPFQITPGQKMTDMTSHDHEASLISRIIETGRSLEACQEIP